MRPRIVAALALAATGSLGAVAAAAGGGSAAPRSDAIVLTDRAIAAPLELPAGRSSIELRNDGKIEHDLLIVRTDTPADGLPLGLEGVAPQLAGRIVFGRLHPGHKHAAAKGRSHHIAPGAARRITLDLERGRHVLLCPLPGHYEAGQRTALTAG